MSLGRKAGAKKPTTKAKADALAAVTKAPVKRLNADVDERKYKRLQTKAINNDTDITALVNQWIDDYLEQ